MEEKIVEFLIKNNLTITTVESCTGGLIAARIVNVSGASYVFKEGYVTYSEESKIKLVNVKRNTIDKYNVVSKEVAYEMALGGAKAACADVSVSVTGVAGPNGGTLDIPVGTICIGVYYKGKVSVIKVLLEGDRLHIRNAAVDKALEFLAELLQIV
jgi:PncC family amidohydrolase